MFVVLDNKKVLIWMNFLTAEFSQTYDAKIISTEPTTYGDVVTDPSQTAYSPLCGLILVGYEDNDGNYTRAGPDYLSLCPISGNTCTIEGFSPLNETLNSSYVIPAGEIQSYIDPIARDSPAFEATFHYDFRGTRVDFLRGFCTGAYNPPENTVSFYVTGREKAAWGFYLFTGLFLVVFSVTGLLCL